MELDIERKAREPDDSAVRSTLDDCDFSEILVERNQHPCLFMRTIKNFLITRIRIPVARPERVVPGFSQSFAQVSRHAGIQQESQSTRSVIAGSTRSCATNLYA